MPVAGKDQEHRTGRQPVAAAFRAERPLAVDDIDQLILVEHASGSDIEIVTARVNRGRIDLVGSHPLKAHRRGGNAPPVIALVSHQVFELAMVRLVHDREKKTGPRPVSPRRSYRIVRQPDRLAPYRDASVRARFGAALRRSKIDIFPHTSAPSSPPPANGGMRPSRRNSDANDADDPFPGKTDRRKRRRPPRSGRPKELPATFC